MGKKVLIINGHPDQESFNFSLAAAYKKGLIETGAAVEEIMVGNLRFDPNLKYGYQKRMQLEPDLQRAWEKIQWCEHMVWVHPVWWGGLPAMTKGFIDRLFLPGMAFKYKENSIWWDKLLSNKTAHIITTLDQPGWYYGLVYGRPSINQLKKSTLGFCGIGPTKVTYIGIVKNSTPEKKQQWLDKVYRLGLKQK